MIGKRVLVDVSDRSVSGQITSVDAGDDDQAVLHMQKGDTEVNVPVDSIKCVQVV
jgi:hypothetical protein